MEVEAVGLGNVNEGMKFSRRKKKGGKQLLTVVWGVSPLCERG